MAVSCHRLACKGWVHLVDTEAVQRRDLCERPARLGHHLRADPVAREAGDDVSGPPGHGALTASAVAGCRVVECSSLASSLLSTSPPEDVPLVWSRSACAPMRRVSDISPRRGESGSARCRGRRADTGTASVLADTAWHSIGAGSVPIVSGDCQGEEMENQVSIWRRIRVELDSTCFGLAPRSACRVPWFWMHRANGIGKRIPAFIAPFAPPTR